MPGKGLLPVFSLLELFLDEKRIATRRGEGAITRRAAPLELFLDEKRIATNVLEHQIFVLKTKG